MKFIIPICLVLGLTLGQQCGKEFEDFRGCLKQKIGGSPPTPKEFPGGSVSEEVKSCFTSNSCAAPQLIGEEGAGSEEIMGALLKCSDKVKDEIKTMTQGCMIKHPNIGDGFVLHPDLIAPLPFAVPNPPPAPPAIVILSSTGQIYDDKVCPGGKEVVRNCVMNVAEKFMPTPSDNKSPVEATLDLAKVCYSQKECKKDMSSTCRNDLDSIRSYLCNCAKELFEVSSNVDKLVDTFKTCMTDNAGSGSSSSPEVQQVQEHAQTLFTNLMCMEAPDPCKPPEAPPAGAQGQPGQGGQGFGQGPPPQGGGGDGFFGRRK